MNNFSILSFNKRKRQINKKQNRDLIITAARKLFAERGFDNASIRQIILEANLGSGTFTDNTQVRPSRESSPDRDIFSFLLVRLCVK